MRLPLQRYIELLERGELGHALAVLRDCIAPLQVVDAARLDALTTLVLAPDASSMQTILAAKLSLVEPDLTTTMIATTSTTTTATAKANADDVALNERLAQARTAALNSLTSSSLTSSTLTSSSTSTMTSQHRARRDALLCAIARRARRNAMLPKQRLEQLVVQVKRR